MCATVVCDNRLMVCFLMTSLGELVAYMPVSGSFATYGSRYVEEGYGFVLGWNCCYNWAVTIAVELVASQLIMSYWCPRHSGLDLKRAVFGHHVSAQHYFGERFWRGGITGFRSSKLSPLWCLSQWGC